jgi:hypothetical protein
MAASGPQMDLEEAPAQEAREEEEEAVAMEEDGGGGKSKKKRYRRDKPWDHEGIDHWKVRGQPRVPDLRDMEGSPVASAGG